MNILLSHQTEADPAHIKRRTIVQRAVSGVALAAAVTGPMSACSTEQSFVVDKTEIVRIDPNLIQAAYAVCTGEQSVPVTSGNTLTGLVEEFVQTMPADRLKSGSNLSKIADAIAIDQSLGDKDADPNIYVYQNTINVPPAGLEAGVSYPLPKECHLTNPVPTR